eukprot:292574-Hanusia_phi.AAC.9
MSSSPLPSDVPSCTCNACPAGLKATHHWLALLPTSAQPFGNARYEKKAIRLLSHLKTLVRARYVQRRYAFQVHGVDTEAISVSNKTHFACAHNAECSSKIFVAFGFPLAAAQWSGVSWS